MSSGKISIDRTTTIKALLDANEGAVIEALVKLNSNFGKLKNPLLRKLFARRVSIADACKISGCNISDFLKTMETIGFLLKGDQDSGGEYGGGSVTLPKGMVEVDLDVRPVLAENKDPLKLILSRIAQLQAGECLKLINSFEPTPLITLLKGKGYESLTEQITPDLVYTWFFQSPLKDVQESMERASSDSLPSFDEKLRKFESRLRVIDVTALEMPLPMQTILEALKALPANEALFVHHKKVPVYLFPHLQDQGFDYLIREEEGGRISLLIFK